MSCFGNVKTAKAAKFKFSPLQSSFVSETNLKSTFCFFKGYSKLYKKTLE